MTKLNVFFIAMVYSGLKHSFFNKPLGISQLHYDILGGLDIQFIIDNAIKKAVSLKHERKLSLTPNSLFLIMPPTKRRCLSPKIKSSRIVVEH